MNTTHACEGTINVTRGAYVPMRPTPPGVEHLEIRINTCDSDCPLTQIVAQEPQHN